MGENSSRRGRPLYGVAGWLSLFVALLTLETLMTFWNVYLALQSQNITAPEFVMSTEPWAIFPKSVLVVMLATTALIVSVAITRKRWFRPAALAALLSRGPLYVCAYLVAVKLSEVAVISDATGEPATSSSAGLTFLLVIWAIECLIGISYLQRSRRVRLTYEDAIKVAKGQERRPEPALADLRFVRADAVPVMNRQSPVPPAMPMDVPEAAWAAAWEELHSDACHRGLWARLLAQADGDVHRAEAMYLRIRAQSRNESRDVQHAVSPTTPHPVG